MPNLSDVMTVCPLRLTFPHTLIANWQQTGDGSEDTPSPATCRFCRLNDFRQRAQGEISTASRSEIELETGQKVPEVSRGITPVCGTFAQ
jgi:hypothetical protein